MSKIFGNQTAIVSGGMGDIGRAICQEFAKQGAHVAFCDQRSPTEARDFIARLENEHGVSCLYHQVDVSDAAQVNLWIREVGAHFGKPRLIVANAARATIAPVLEVTPDQWCEELNVNLNGAFYMAQAAARQMTEQQIAGHIIFLGSWAAHKVHLNMPAYSVSKAALRMLCKSMALELAPYGILVNEVAPGYVKAGLSGKIWQQQPGLREKAAENIPTGKFISPEDVAHEVTMLCHPDNRHRTGTTVLMDGGLSLS